MFKGGRRIGSKLRRVVGSPNVIDVSIARTVTMCMRMTVRVACITSHVPMSAVITEFPATMAIVTVTVVHVAMASDMHTAANLVAAKPCAIIVTRVSHLDLPRFLLGSDCYLHRFC